MPAKGSPFHTTGPNVGSNSSKAVALPGLAPKGTAAPTSTLPSSTKPLRNRNSASVQRKVFASPPSTSCYFTDLEGTTVAESIESRGSHSTPAPPKPKNFYAFYENPTMVTQRDPKRAAQTDNAESVLQQPPSDSSHFTTKKGPLRSLAELLETEPAVIRSCNCEGKPPDVHEKVRNKGTATQSGEGAGSCTTANKTPTSGRLPSLRTPCAREGPDSGTPPRPTSLRVTNVDANALGVGTTSAHTGGRDIHEIQPVCSPLRVSTFFRPQKPSGNSSQGEQSSAITDDLRHRSLSSRESPRSTVASENDTPLSAVSIRRDTVMPQLVLPIGRVTELAEVPEPGALVGLSPPAKAHLRTPVSHSHAVGAHKGDHRRGTDGRDARQSGGVSGRTSDLLHYHRATIASASKPWRLNTSGPSAPNGDMWQHAAEVNHGEILVDVGDTHLVDEARMMTFELGGPSFVNGSNQLTSSGHVVRPRELRRSVNIVGPFSDVCILDCESVGELGDLTSIAEYRKAHGSSASPPKKHPRTTSTRNVSVLLADGCAVFYDSRAEHSGAALLQGTLGRRTIPFESIIELRMVDGSDTMAEMLFQDTGSWEAATSSFGISTRSDSGARSCGTPITAASHGADSISAIADIQPLRSSTAGRQPRRLLLCFSSKHATSIISGIAQASVSAIRQLESSHRRTLTIVHFNDVYSLLPVNTESLAIAGGASRFHTILGAVQARAVPLVLFSGDFMGPSLMSVDMKGKHMVDCLNTLGVHFACFGNHEFDYGKKALYDAVCGFTQGPFVFTGSKTQWIMSNMTEGDGSPLCGAADRALISWNGVRVGIVGLCENWLPGCSQLKPGDMLFHDMFECGERIASELRERGADIVVALTHCRINNDKEIMRRCPSIDLLLGGHDHFYKCVPSLRVVKSGEEFNFLTEITVEFETSWNPKLLHSSGPRNQAAHTAPSSVSLSSTTALGTSTSAEDFWSDQVLARSNEAAPSTAMRLHVVAHPVLRATPLSPVMERVIRRYEAKLNERMGGIIGITKVDLDPRECVCRYREGLLTGFVCDVVVSEMETEEFKADFAIIGGAAFSGKSIIPKGYLTLGNIFDLFPNDTKVMAVRMTGRTVLKLLTVMVREMPEEAPSFPHCSAELRFTISLLGPTPCIKDVLVHGVPLDEKAEYVVALEDFAGKGNGKYSFVPLEGKQLTDEDSARQIVYWITDYFNSKKGQKLAGMEAGQGSGISEEGELSGGQETGSRMISEMSLVRRTATPQYRFPLRHFNYFEFAATLSATSLARVYAATTLLTDEIESDQNASRLERIIAKLLKCQVARIYWLDESSGCLNLYTSPGEPTLARTASLPADSGSIAGYCVSHRCAVNILDSATDPAFVPEVDGAQNNHISTMLSFPVVFKKECLGVIQAINKSDEFRVALSDFQSQQVGGDWLLSSSPEGRSPKSISRDEDVDGSTGHDARRLSHVSPMSKAGCGVVFTEEDVGLALLLSKQIGVQLHFSNVVRRLQRSERATQNLMEMVRLLGRAQQSDSVAEMVTRVTEVGIQIIGCDRCSLYLVDKGEMWTVVKSHNLMSNLTIRLPIGHGVAGVCARDGLLMNVHDAYQCEHFDADYDKKTGYHTKTILCVPMLSESKDSILGVLQLINKNDGKVFSKADEELAQNFVSIAAIAIHNSFEIEVLRMGCDDSMLQVLPVHDLNRIEIKGGWHTVRRQLGYIISPEFQNLLLGRREERGQSFREGAELVTTSLARTMSGWANVDNERKFVTSAFKEFGEIIR